MTPPLYQAVRIGLVDVVTDFLQKIKGGNVSPSSRPTDQNPTQGAYGDELRVACFYGHRAIVEYLVDAGADIEATGGDLQHALGVCMYRNRDPSIIQLLLSRISKSFFEPPSVWIAGWVLRWAAMEGNLDITRALISKKDISERQNFSWTTQYVSTLRARGMHPEEVYFRRSYSRLGTAPYEAASAGHYQILYSMVDKWTSIDETDHEGRSALYLGSILWPCNNGESTVEKGSPHIWTSHVF